MCNPNRLSIISVVVVLVVGDDGGVVVVLTAAKAAPRLTPLVTDVRTSLTRNIDLLIAIMLA